MTSQFKANWAGIVKAILLPLLATICLAARAHGPFDNSAQAIIGDESIEVVVTVGAEGARRFLIQAGMSEAEVVTALANRGPSTSFALDASVSSKLFEVEAPGEVLMARHIAVMTDGLEAIFTLIYPRPKADRFRFRAHYFDGIEMMKPGSFIATDENRNTLGAAMLARTNSMVEVQATPNHAKPLAPEAPSKIASSMPASLSMPAPAKVSGNTQPRSHRRYLWVGGVVLTAVGLRVVARKLTQ